MSKYLDMFIKNDTIQYYGNGAIYPCFRNTGERGDNLTGLLFKSPEESMYFDFRLKHFISFGDVEPVKVYSGYTNNRRSISLKDKLTSLQDWDFRAVFLFNEKVFCLFYDSNSNKSYIFSLFGEPEIKTCLLQNIDVSCVYRPEYSVG